MIAWFSRHGIEDAVIRKASEVGIAVAPSPANCNHSARKSFWLRLPYHWLVYSSGLGRVIRDVILRWSPIVGNAFGIGGFNVRIAWQAGGPNLLAYANRGWQ